MRYAQYRHDFETLYPNFGPAPLMQKFGISRHHATKIACVLGIARLPREERTCWTCPAPLAGLPRHTGNYCQKCFNAQRVKPAKAPQQYLRILYHRAKNRAGKRGVAFDLTPEHLWTLWEQQGHKCFYSGVEMQTTGRERDPYGVSIDRIYPSRGYTLGNVVLCCWGVNTAKGEFTLAEFLHLCQQVARNGRLTEMVKSSGGADPRTDPVG